MVIEKQNSEATSMTKQNGGRAKMQFLTEYTSLRGASTTCQLKVIDSKKASYCQGAKGSMPK
jgi:hypothetical protein